LSVLQKVRHWLGLIFWVRRPSKVKLIGGRMMQYWVCAVGVGMSFDGHGGFASRGEGN
jgi:hypothetical protein